MCYQSERTQKTVSGKSDDVFHSFIFKSTLSYLNANALWKTTVYLICPGKGGQTIFQTKHLVYDLHLYDH